jgi:putative sterol carrier protein
MSTLPTIPADTSVADLLSKIMPSVVEDLLATNSAAQELSGTQICMVVEVNGEKYAYTLKDGKTLSFTKGDISGTNMYIKITEDDLKKMIQTQNLDMLFGLQSDLNKSKYNALNSLKGSFTAEIANEDGYTFKIEAVLNGAQQPHSIFKMSAKDTAALMRKDTNPVNLFMSGAMKIEGDMSFAMATQPLFS